MRENKKTMILTTLVCLIPIVAGVILYPNLPDQMVIHWNAKGEPDGWTNKLLAVIGLPGILAVVNLLMPILLKADPKHQNMNQKLVTISLWIIPVVSLFCSAMTLGHALGIDWNVEKLAPILVGVMLMVVGNYLPKTRQSYTMGIKLPWTLNSEENWNKTHRLAGFLWVISGLGMIGGAFTPWVMGIFVLVMVFCVLVPMVYSYLLYRKGI